MAGCPKTGRNRLKNRTYAARRGPTGGVGSPQPDLGLEITQASQHSHHDVGETARTVKPKRQSMMRTSLLGWIRIKSCSTENS